MFKLCLLISVFLLSRPFLYESKNYSWNPYQIGGTRSSKVHEKSRLASDFVNQPVYVSLTTIQNRLADTVETISSILHGSLQPTEVFLFVSENPYLLDKGVTREQIVSSGLHRLIQLYPFSIIFTENIGPHRKLLPLLQKKWNEDCVIITLDDHSLYPHDTIESILTYYIASNKASVVALRARRIGLCADAHPSWRMAPYPKRGYWPIANIGREEMLMLPTGAGGVLYRPKFFNEKLIFDKKLRNITSSGDDLMFRLGTLSKGIKVVTGCNSIVSSLDSSREITCPQQIVFRRNPSRRLRSSSTSDKLGVMSINTTKIESGNTSESYIGRRRTEGGVGLWSNINKASRANDVMWQRAVRYLKEIGLYDFDLDLQRYAPLERNYCKLHLGDSYPAKVLFSLMGEARTSLQSAYDHECGIQHCRDSQ